MGTMKAWFRKCATGVACAVGGTIVVVLVAAIALATAWLIVFFVEA